jgi:hypothetical protein
MSEPGEEVWTPTQRQIARAERSKAVLRRYQVPTYHGPLFVDDDEEVSVRAGPETAKRVLVLWAVELRAEGMSQEEALGLIDRAGLSDAVSPSEKLFLQESDPNPEECSKLVWRLESIWVLLWALRHVKELDWPRGMCDVPQLVDILKPNETNPEFITTAQLRPVKEILDAQDLIMRIHWAIRDSLLNSQLVPENLDWSDESAELVPATMCHAVGVVEERHHALNWLTCFLGDQWDDVQTPT